MTGFLNLTVNIIMATSGAVNPAVSEQPMELTRCTDIPVTTLKFRYADPRPDLFGVDFDVRQMDRASRLV